MDFLTQATVDVMNKHNKINQNKEEEALSRFKENFHRLPQAFQDGLVELAQEELDIQDKEKEETEDL